MFKVYNRHKTDKNIPGEFGRDEVRIFTEAFWGSETPDIPGEFGRDEVRIFTEAFWGSETPDITGEF